MEDGDRLRVTDGEGGIGAGALLGLESHRGSMFVVVGGGPPGVGSVWRKVPLEVAMKNKAGAGAGAGERCSLASFWAKFSRM